MSDAVPSTGDKDEDSTPGREDPVSSEGYSTLLMLPATSFHTQPSADPSFWLWDSLWP